MPEPARSALAALRTAVGTQAAAIGSTAAMRSWRYPLLADHRIDRRPPRFDGKVSAGQRRSVCECVEQGTRAGACESAVIVGIRVLSELIARRFPRGRDHIDRNELPDLPHMP